MTGKVVFNQQMPIENRTTFSVDIASGIYVLNVKTINGHESQLKFIAN
jgi:hypothetical protein